MEHVYTVHTKLIQDKTYYFVKKLLSLSEFKSLAEIVVGYGMHTNFEKACSIAGIHDSTLRSRLLLELEQHKKTAVQTVIQEKPMQQPVVQISEMVNRWLAERGAAILN